MQYSCKQWKVSFILSLVVSLLPQAETDLFWAGLNNKLISLFHGCSQNVTGTFNHSDWGNGDTFCHTESQAGSAAVKLFDYNHLRLRQGVDKFVDVVANQVFAQLIPGVQIRLYLRQAIFSRKKPTKRAADAIYAI